MISTPPSRCFRGADVPIAEIRRFARQVAERFQPEMIILFGSHAYGTPHADSDVDILVIMPARNQRDQAVKIRWEIQVPFPMDLLVRSPKNLQWRLDERESFHAEIVTRGKVLYEKGRAGMGAKAEDDYRLAATIAGGSEAYHDQQCFGQDHRGSSGRFDARPAV